MVFCAIMGISVLFARYPSLKYRGGIIFLVLLFLVINGVKVASFAKKNSHKSILPFKQVEKIKEITGDQPVIVAVDNDMANAWAVYFLRDVPIHLTRYRLYMAQSHVVP